LDTIKGQGVTYFEQLFDNHHIRFTGEGETALKDAIAEFEKQLTEVDA
jgi:transketolase